MENFNNFCNQNGFIGFNRPQMKTEMKNGVEKKSSPFAGCEGWKEYSQTSIKKNPEWKTFAIMTGKVSDITVIDFDDHSQLQSFQKAFPEFCEKAFQVKSQSGGLHFTAITERILQMYPMILALTSAMMADVFLQMAQRC